MIHKMKQHKRYRFLLLTILILLAALSRLLPHWPNFTPLGAMALFGAAYFSRKSLAFIVPLLALYISDLLLNNWILAEFFDGPVFTISPWTYGSFVLVILLGFLLLRGRVKPLRVVGAGVSASLLFFLISNFGVWMEGGMYPLNFGGLLLCYEAAIPFFWNTLAGDLFYCAVLFGGFAWAQSRYPALWIGFQELKGVNHKS